MALSKQARADQMVDIWVGSRTRTMIIEMLIEQLGVGKAHASTMYQTARMRIKKKYLGDMHQVDGLYRWKSNERIPPQECLIKAGLKGAVLEMHKKVEDEESLKELEEYRERMKDHVPSDEELFEMRAAFGEGETVVNVLTGQRVQL